MAKPVMSRADALALIERGKNDPEFMKIYMDGSHPRHREAVEGARHAFYWAYDHPANKDGSPVPLESLPGYVDPDASEWPDLDRLTADQAKARIEKLQNDPEFQTFMRERDHAEHADAVSGMAHLHKIAYPEPTGAEAPASALSPDLTAAMEAALKSLPVGASSGPDAVSAPPPAGASSDV